MALIFHSQLMFTKITTEEMVSSFEFTSFQCKLGSEETMGLIIIYHPPNKSAEFLEEICQVLINQSLCYNKNILLGDFNCWADDVEHLVAQQLINFAASVGYTKGVRGPTHMAGHTLDWDLYSGLLLKFFPSLAPVEGQ